MAQIVGGIATSHTPTIAFAKDAKKFDDPVWKPIFEGYEPVRRPIVALRRRDAVVPEDLVEGLLASVSRDELER